MFQTLLKTVSWYSRLTFGEEHYTLNFACLVSWWYSFFLVWKFAQNFRKSSLHICWQTMEDTNFEANRFLCSACLSTACVQLWRRERKSPPSKKEGIGFWYQPAKRTEWKFNGKISSTTVCIQVRFQCDPERHLKGLLRPFYQIIVPVS